MKKEELFEGAIVLARKSTYSRRSRFKILEIYDLSVKLKDKDGCILYARFEHLRPAKITPMSLKELGFNWDLQICHSGREGCCNQYKYTLDDERAIRVTLKEDCNLWGSTVVLYDNGIHQVRYIHEVQKILSNQQS